MTNLELHHPEILELPGVALVEILGEEALAVVERIPVAVLADDLAEIGPADIENALVIDLVRLTDRAPLATNGQDALPICNVR